jgi:hypothetical protein
MSSFNLKVINQSSCNSLLRLFVPFVHSSVSPSSLSPPAPPRMSMVSIHDANDLCSLPLNKVGLLNCKTLNFAFLSPLTFSSMCSGAFPNHLPLPSPLVNSPTFSRPPPVSWCVLTHSYILACFPGIITADTCPSEGPRSWPCV